MENPGAIVDLPEDEIPDGKQGKRTRSVLENVEPSSEISGTAGEGDFASDCGLRRRIVNAPGETSDRSITSCTIIPMTMESTSDDSFKGYYDLGSGNDKRLGSVARRILEPEMPNRDQPPRMKKRKKRKSRKSTMVLSAKSVDSNKPKKEEKSIIRKLWNTGDEFKVPQVDSYPIFVMRDFVIYITFMTVICIIVFGSKGSAYNYYSDVISTLVTKSFYNTSVGLQITFRDVQNRRDMWTFTTEILCKILYDRTYFSDRQRIIMSGSRVQTENVIFGAPQIRQLRVRTKTCTPVPMFQDVIEDCADYYSEELEDKSTFGLASSAWRYIPPPEEHSYFTGKVSTYPEGGFMMNFTTDEQFTMNHIAELREENWIRYGTRAVFIDFVLFNPNTHLFCVCKLIFEMPPIGGILPSYRFYTLKLLRYVEPRDFFILSCEMIFICFTVYYTFEELMQIIRLREAYLSNWWNILDIMIIICSYFAITCGIISATKTRRFVAQNVDKIHTTNHVSFDKVVDIQSLFDVSMAMVVFVVWLKIFKFSTLNRTVSLIFSALIRVGPALIVVTVMMFSVLIGFAIFGFIMFGSLVYSFKTFGDSLFTMIRLVTGGINWQDDLSNHGIANHLLLWYAVILFLFVRLMIMNLYVALIVSGFDEEVRELNELSNTATIGDVFREVCCKFLVFIGKTSIALHLDQREVVKQHMKIYDALLVVLRRHGYEGVEADLILEKHQITYGTPIPKETMSAMYDDIHVRNQLSLEVEDHNKLKEQIEQMEKIILVIDQTLMGLMTKVDILTNRFIQKKSSGSTSTHK